VSTSRGTSTGEVEVDVRRSRLISSFIALAAVVSGSLILVAPTAGADTAEPEIAYEGWYARAKGEDPQVVIPCSPPTPRGCGPVSPADFPAPQSKSTGAYVVSSAGGRAGDSDGEGDTGWAAFQWDLFPYLGATAEKFVVTLSQAEDNGFRNQGDTWSGGEIFIQACNVLDGWSSEPGSNPWITRPPVSDECVVPTIDPEKRQFTFDVSSFAQSWLDGKGYGFVIRPGTPDRVDDLPPFQITFSGYYDAPVTGATGSTTSPTPPKVVFDYTPAEEEDLFEDIDDDSGDDEFIEEVIDNGGGDDDFTALPDLDVSPTDVGSEEEPVEEEPAEEALPTTGPRRTRPISTETGFPWAILLLLPLAMIAFWSTGTALGPVGDPVPLRQGGVSRVLAERQTADRGDHLETRNR
jgi:hypothetical protein